MTSTGAAREHTPRSLYASIKKRVEAMPGRRQTFKLEALDEALRFNQYDLLCLYDKYLVDHRPFNIRAAVEAHKALGHRTPYDAVTPECMAVVSRFQQAVMEERISRNDPAMDAQSMTILLQWVVSHPEDLETIISLAQDRGMRSYKENLNALRDIKTQGIKRPLHGGAL